MSSRHPHHGFRSSSAGALLCLVLIFSPTEALNQNKKVAYGRNILFGFDVQPLPEAVIVLSADLTSGEFFDGLQRIETSGAPEYRKGSARVNRYPEELQVEVHAAISRHFGMLADAPLPMEVTELLSSLHFEAHWKRAMQMRPAQSLTIRMCRPPTVGWGKVWIYQLAIRDRDVPLTDHLVVSILTKEHKPLTLFSAQL